jgi:hypothetical protein
MDGSHSRVADNKRKKRYILLSFIYNICLTSSIHDMLWKEKKKKKKKKKKKLVGELNPPKRLKTYALNRKMTKV